MGGVAQNKDTMTCLETPWLEQCVHDRSVETFGYCSVTAKDAEQSKGAL